MRLLVLLLLLSGAAVSGAPVNDHFFDAVLLSGSSVEVTADNSNATTEPGEPTHELSFGRSLWWSWTAPNDGWLTVDVSSNVFTPAFSLYTGPTLTNLQFIASTQMRCPELAWFADFALSANEIFRVSANQTYHFVLSSPMALRNEFSPETAPRGRFRFSIVYSTIEIIVPVHGQRFFTTSTIPVEVTLADPPTTISRLALEIDGVLQTTNLPSAVNGSRFSLALNPLSLGPHSIRARSLYSDNSIHWSPPVTFSIGQPNDDFANAIHLVGTNVTAIGDVGYTGPEHGEIFNPSSSASTIWYRWIAPTNGIVRLSTSSDHIAVSVQRRNRAGILEIIANNAPIDSFLDSPVFNVLHFSAFSSTVYYLQFALILQSPTAEPSGPCDLPRLIYPLPFAFQVQLLPSHVSTPDIFLSRPDLGHGDGVVLIFSASRNTPYSIHSSTNLVDWQPRSDGIANGSSELVFVPSGLTAPFNFFRLLTSPQSEP
jgi:hypothetical protein